MKTAFVTGVSGQDGSYLTELLLSKGYMVYGLDRRKADASKSNISHLLSDKNLKIIDGDLLEVARILAILKNIKPDEVYHLASQSFVKTSWDVPIYTLNVNILGTARILEAIRIHSAESKFYFASSSEIFGEVMECPQKELTPHNPLSPYGVSKSASHFLTRQARSDSNMFACNGICFNHESERRGLEFVTRKITNAVALFSQSKLDRLLLGNLDAKRDWGYAPDYVRAMWMILQHDVPDDYVICTGVEHSVREFVESAFKSVEMDIEWKGKGLDETGVCDGETVVSVSSEFYRPLDVETLCGDCSKIKEELGWRPTVAFEEMVSRMVKNDIKLISLEV